MKIIIEGDFTTCNEYIDAERANRWNGAKIKKSETERVAWPLKTTRDVVPRIPHRFHFTWYCLDKRQDPDNICFAKKFILDGLKVAGIIPTDGWAVVGGFQDDFEVDAKHPRVEVEILPIAP